MTHGILANAPKHILVRFIVGEAIASLIAAGVLIWAFVGNAAPDDQTVFGAVVIAVVAMMIPSAWFLLALYRVRRAKPEDPSWVVRKG